MADSPNVALVRRYFERWSTSDFSVDLDDVDPEVELHTHLAKVKGEPYVGHEGVRQWNRDIEESFDEFRSELEEVRERGDRVVCLGSIHMRGRGSGLELDQQAGWIADFRKGKVLRLEIHPSHEEALAAAGIEP